MFQFIARHSLNAAQQMGMYCAVGDYSSGSGEKQALEVWQNSSSFNAPAFYIKQEGQYHDGFEYTHIDGDETHHIAVCKYCGYSEGGIDTNGSPAPAVCVFGSAEEYATDAEKYYKQCLCSNVDKKNGEAHVYDGSWYPTDDLQKHVSRCEVCGYENGTPESHTGFFDGTNTCTKCGFVYIALDYKSQRFNKVEAALYGGSDNVTIAAKTTVGLESTLGLGVDENIYFDPMGEGSKQAEVTLWTQGRLLYADVGTTLRVNSGTLTLTNNDTQKPGIQIIQDGWVGGNGASAVCLSGGTLIFNKDLTASGGYNSNGNAQYPAVAAYNGALSFNGNVALEGGLYLTGGVVLETPLKAGDHFYASATRSLAVRSQRTNNKIPLFG